MDFENNLPRVDPIRMTHNGDSVYGRIAIEALLDLLKRIRGAAGFQEKLDLITEGIASCGWRRVHLYILDSNVSKLESASSWGLSEKELEHIRSSGMKMEDFKALLGPEFDKYRIGRSYYFPHNCIDPFAVKMRSSALDSSLSTEEFLDWNPADLLYFPLEGFDGEIVGMLSVDDPINGKRPNEDSLSIVELFIDAVIGLIEEGEFKDYFSKTRGLLSKLFDLSPTSLLLLDENERIVDANAAALDALGYEQGELIGQPECGIIASNETYKSILRGRKEGSYRGEVLISGKKGDIWGLFF
ncbi:PAS domain-containing protein, partial [bacterium]|nr:PAS domain-containing protein [bacterium]